MMKEAHAEGCDMVVFTELALTTFFPRYYAEDRADIDRLFVGVPGDPAQLSLYGVHAQRKAESDIHHALDYVRHAAMRGRIGEAA